MDETRTQKHRDVAIGTPLGEDVLLLTSMSVSEQLGRPFRYELGLVSEDLQVKAADIVGQNVTVRLNLLSGKVRYFNGFVSRFVQTPSSGDEAQYTATVVPWLWFLTRTADCRIFQEMKVPDIIKQVFKDYGFTGFFEDKGLSGKYRTWPYCVQYRETGFNFVSRLMEQEGIYYFFTHENGKHTLNLADSASSHKAYPDYEEIKYRPYKAEEDKEVITKWTAETRLQPGSYVLNDFDFENTKKDLQARSEIPRDHAVAEMEIFDYPGEYTETGEGEKYARTRIEELHTQYEIATAVSDARGICTGCTFTLKECSREDQNKEYLIVSANYNIDAGGYESGAGGGGATYSCSFTAIDVKQPFRSLRITPKPSIPGPQTAIVVGKSGEEIYTDKYGRVKVQFHWDRRASGDENSSCWIRVAQVWAGKKWGAMYIPRVGQEVIVEFLEGDPDHPIITGRVYNAQAMPPYDPSADKTISTIKSNSSKGGGGFNEIRFEDLKDKEQIFIHAQKDHDVRVENDLKEWIGNERHLIVTTDQIEQVDGDKHLTVAGNQNEKIDGTISIEAGSDIQEKAAMNYGFEAGSNIHIKGGMNVVIEAGIQLTIKAGSSFVDIGPAGVSITGTMVNINSGGAAGSGAGASPDAPKAPEEADQDQPGETAEPPQAREYSPQAVTLQWCAVSGTPFCEQCEKAKK
jgi:type VI secretion system secreted protein VgrG